ncbi:MAG: CBS domain-containing protein [Bacilli bacterium]|jgi:CBS domain-containing protein
MNILFYLLPKAQVEYVYDDFTIRQALEKMEYHHYSTIPVISHEGKYVGSISEGDILWEFKRQNLSLTKCERHPISKIVPFKKITPISADKDMDDLVDIIINQNFVPVVDDFDNFIGIITRKSVINFLTNELNKRKS